MFSLTYTLILSTNSRSSTVESRFYEASGRIFHIRKIEFRKTNFPLKMMGKFKKTKINKIKNLSKIIEKLIDFFIKFYQYLSRYQYICIINMP